MPELDSSLLGNCCPCGAAVEHGKQRCRKCRARSRYIRKVRQRRPVAPRGGNVRPAHRGR